MAATQQRSSCSSAAQGGVLSNGEAGDARGGAKGNLAAERLGEKAADDLRRHVSATVVLVMTRGGYGICGERMES